MNKKGSVLAYIFISFIAVLLFLTLARMMPDFYDDLKQEELFNSSTSFIVSTTVNETLTPIEEGIKTLTATRQNSTWLNFDGVDDYLFIPQFDYVSVSLWVRDNATGWKHIVNSSDLIYENNSTVASFTLNPFKRNATGWYFGINSSGFFKGSIDTIKFYNDTMNETQVLELFDDGR